MLYTYELERSVYKRVSFFAKDQDEAIGIADQLAKEFADDISEKVECDDDLYDFHFFDCEETGGK